MPTQRMGTYYTHVLCSHSWPVPEIFLGFSLVALSHVTTHLQGQDVAKQDHMMEQVLLLNHDIDVIL